VGGRRGSRPRPCRRASPASDLECWDRPGSRNRWIVRGKCQEGAATASRALRPTSSSPCRPSLRTIPSASHSRRIVVTMRRVTPARALSCPLGASGADFDKQNGSYCISSAARRLRAVVNARTLQTAANVGRTYRETMSRNGLTAGAVQTTRDTVRTVPRRRSAQPRPPSSPRTRSSRAGYSMTDCRGCSARGTPRSPRPRGPAG
jgi:hypothetical protein